jgi:hypothetical protein
MFQQKTFYSQNSMQQNYIVLIFNNVRNNTVETNAETIILEQQKGPY